MIQSPKKSNAAIQNEKKLVQGVGYVTIYTSNKESYELTAQETVLRRTVAINGKFNKALYYKVTDSEKIKEIERISENWGIPKIARDPNGYIIKVQRTGNGTSTGNLKIVKRSKAKFYGFSVVADAWTYYERRKTENEI